MNVVLPLALALVLLFWLLELLQLPLRERRDRNLRMPLGGFCGGVSLGNVFETTRDLEYCIWGRPVGAPGEGEPIGEVGKAPGIVLLCEESGRAKSDVDGCCCRGLGISTGVFGRDDFLGGGEGGGGGMSVPAVKDSKENGSAGSWNAETLCV